MAAGVVTMVAMGGCVSLDAVRHDPLQDQISYVKRAAEADHQAWMKMKSEADRRADKAPFESKLQLGFLLTSPNESQENTRAGEEILKDILARRPGLDPRLRGLIQIRLQDAEARRALQKELKDVKDKIDKLLSIESSTGQKGSRVDTEHAE